MIASDEFFILRFRHYFVEICNFKKKSNSIIFETLGLFLKVYLGRYSLKRYYEIIVSRFSDIAEITNESPFLSFLHLFFDLLSCLLIIFE